MVKSKASTTDRTALSKIIVQKSVDRSTFSYENEAGIKTKRHGKKSYDIMTPYARAMALPNLPPTYQAIAERTV